MTDTKVYHGRFILLNVPLTKLSNGQMDKFCLLRVSASLHGAEVDGLVGGSNLTPFS